MQITSNLIQMQYEPRTDTLSVEWPCFSTVTTVPELQHILDQLLQTVRHYDVHRLLLDARHAIPVLYDQEQMDTVLGFLHQLRGTRVRKVARVVENTFLRDTQQRQIAAEAEQAYQFQTFSDIDVALGWLGA